MKSLFVIVSSVVLCSCGAPVKLTEAPQAPDLPTEYPVSHPEVDAATPTTGPVVVNGVAYSHEATVCKKSYDGSYRVYIKATKSQTEKLWVVLAVPDGVTNGVQQNQGSTGLTVTGSGDPRPSSASDYYAANDHGMCSFAFNGVTGTIECSLTSPIFRKAPLGDAVKLNKLTFHCQ